MSNRNQIWLYLALVVAGSVVFNALILTGGGLAQDQTHKWVVAIMWVPGISAMLTALTARRTLAGLGWGPGPWRALLVGWATPAVYAILAVLGAVALGAGTLDPSGWSEAASMIGLLVGPWMGLGAMVTIGTLMSLLTATGEEIGWRGFLSPALGREMGFWRLNAVSGLIWLAYHLPVLLFGGYSGDGTPIWFSLACFTALIFIITPFFNALRLRSGSFWPAALAHASHNLFIQSVMAAAFIAGPQASWLTGEFGILTPLAALVVVGVYFLITGVPRTAFEQARAGD